MIDMPENLAMYSVKIHMEISISIEACSESEAKHKVRNQPEFVVIRKLCDTRVLHIDVQRSKNEIPNQS